ncbi:MAG: minichromosome maintenance protein MCM [Candidatus Undinarchaeales archaeon]
MASQREDTLSKQTFVESTEFDLLEKFETFFREKYMDELLELAGNYPDKQSLNVDFNDLDKFDPRVADQLVVDPEEVLKAAEDSLEEIELSIDGDYSINVRFFNLPESQTVNIRDIRSEDLENLITIDGIVKSASEVRPEATKITYQCPECGKNIVMIQDNKKIKKPRMCDDPTCGARGHFKEVSVELVDIQRIKVQEPPETILGGEQPSELYIVLSDDLTSPHERKKVMPGNRINAVGVLKKMPNNSRRGGRSTRYDLYVYANYIETIQREFEEIELEDKDIEKIKELAGDEKVYEKLIKSMAPSIYGYDEIKEAILLQLFGGVSKVQPDGTRIRGNIHLFLIGDPAVGKSQLLRYVSDLSPKGRFVSGKKASGAGLTAAVVRDEFSGWTLEAGAMVLANNGIATVDEFDKMADEDVSAMLEAMEQGTVSVAKAGIVTTLRANAAVLAAANPKYGRFDQYKPLADQIDIGPVVLSRFDLKFPIRDIPDVDRDTELAGHVLNSLTKPKKIEPEVDAELIRKYVAYARTHCSPKLTEDAKDLIKNFYITWRGKYVADSTENTVSLTPRQLEALIRLSEASARVRLSEKVHPNDARRAIHLLEYALKSLGKEPDTGKIDIDRIDVGISSSQRGKIYTMLDIIDGLAEETEEEDKSISLEEIIESAEDKGIEKVSAMELIKKLKKKGDLFEPKPGFIQKA